MLSVREVNGVGCLPVHSVHNTIITLNLRLEKGGDKNELSPTKRYLEAKSRDS